MTKQLLKTADHVETVHERELPPGADPASIHALMHSERTWDHAHANLEHVSVDNVYFAVAPGEELLVAVATTKAGASGLADIPTKAECPEWFERNELLSGGEEVLFAREGENCRILLIPGRDALEAAGFGHLYEEWAARGAPVGVPLVGA